MTEPLLEIARGRVLDADFRNGGMDDLPWPDDIFDVVTGFNSFFLADDVPAALREAARVARPGGVVATTVFGRPERCDSTRMFRALGKLMASQEDGQEPDQPAGPPPFHEPGVLEGAAEDAGLTVRECDYFELEEVFADLETAVRGTLAPPPLRRASRAFGEARVRSLLEEIYAPLAGEDGRVRQREEVRYLIAEL